MSNCIIPGRDGGSPKARSFRDAVDALSPAIDSVELWLTPTVEQHFEQREAFPELRKACAAAARAKDDKPLQTFLARMSDLPLGPDG